MCKQTYKNLFNKYFLNKPLFLQEFLYELDKFICKQGKEYCYSKEFKEHIWKLLKNNYSFNNQREFNELSEDRDSGGNLIRAVYCHLFENNQIFVIKENPNKRNSRVFIGICEKNNKYEAFKDIKSKYENAAILSEW